MTWNNDPELLQELFRTELDERAARLVEGGRAMQDGELTADECGTMMREGHTIKGTGRVMGFEAISRGGQLLEQTWRRLQHRDLEQSTGLGAALEALAVTLPDAVTADLHEGTDELRHAIAGLNRVLSGDPTPPPGGGGGSGDGDSPAGPHTGPAGPAGSDAAPGPAAPESAASSKPEPVEPVGLVDFPMTAPSSAEPRPVPDGEHVAPREPVGRSPGDAFMKDGTPEPVPAGAGSMAPASDLGGLLNAVESWATEQMVLVNAGRLYRVINDIASLRIDVAAAADLVDGDEADVDGVGADLREAIVAFDGTAAALEADAIALASIPLSEITNTIPQLVRYLAKKTGKDIRFELVGDDLSVDRQILDRIADPVRQLVVNAIEHGVEPPDEREQAGKPMTAVLAVRATLKDHRLEIVVEDDGRGIDWPVVERAAIRKRVIAADADPTEADLRSILFSRGFSTVDEPTELAGDGTGLAVAAEAVETVYGSLRLATKRGEGTAVAITVPASRALQRALVVVVAGQMWGIPEATVEDVIPLEGVVLHDGDDGTFIERSGHRYPVASLAAAVGGDEDGEPTRIVLMNLPTGGLAVTVSRVVGTRRVAAKELGPLISGPSHLTGAALVGGDVVLLVDPVGLASRLTAGDSTRHTGDVLVVDDSRGVRQVLSGALSSLGYTIRVAEDGMEAMAMLREYRPDAVVVDYALPDSDGVSLVEEIRERFGDLPVVMLSAVATPDDQARARRAGVDAYFDKADFREGALAETLVTLISSRGRRNDREEVAL